MAWEDRDYYQQPTGGNAGDYLSNPSAILGYSLRFGTWFGARVRLHFWLLISFAFIIGAGLESGGLLRAPVTLALILAALLLHEFGHRFAARRVGGDHNEFVLWPAGGMVPPTAPPRAGPMFIAHVAGIATNLLLAMACSLALWGLTGRMFFPFVGFLSSFSFAGPSLLSFSSPAAWWLFSLLSISLGIIMANLLPYYWFDGGYLLQTILWPWTGLYRAINITCIVGMVLAVPMLLLSLMAASFLGVVFWGLLFSSAYNRRKQLKAEGTGESEDAVAFSAGLRDSAHPSRRQRWRWAAQRAKQAARERREQQQIDAILAKVHEHGMQSLSWWDKRALRQATKKQRRREQARERGE